MNERGIHILLKLVLIFFKFYRIENDNLDKSGTFRDLTINIFKTTTKIVILGWNNQIRPNFWLKTLKQNYCSFIPNLFCLNWSKNNIIMIYEESCRYLNSKP